MGQCPAIVCPPHLTNVARAFIAEEAVASERHDVRGKLASVRNGAYFLRRKLEGFPQLLASDERVLQFLQLIDDELQALGDRLHSRLPLPEQTPSEAVDLARLAGDLLDRLALPERITVHRPGATGKVRANADELTLALFCLLENAVEATFGVAQPTISVTIEGREDHLLNLSVEDSGAGVSRELRDQMFRPFFTTHPGSVGLGLKIARRIARRWGGELQVLSAASGARLALVLPALLPQRTRAGAGRGVLLVDDKDSARFAMRALLETEGYRVSESSSLAEARTSLSGGPFDLVIIDLHLGDGLGTELMGPLKERQPRAVVVMMSGSEPPPTPGISLYLTKTTAPELILSRLEKVLTGAVA